MEGGTAFTGKCAGGVHCGEVADGKIQGLGADAIEYVEDGTCPRQEVSGNMSGEFVMRTDFLPYVLRTPVFRIFLAWDKYYTSAATLVFE